MGDINPTTNPATAGYTNRVRDVFYIDDTSTTAITTLNRRRRLGCYRIISYFLADWDNADTIRLPNGSFAAAWQANTGTDQANISIGTSGGSFSTAATNPDGWVHFLCRGNSRSGIADNVGVVDEGTEGTTSDTITAKGSTGYIDPYRAIFLNHKSDTPNTLTQAKVASKLGLKFQIFPFVMGSQDDTWKCVTGTRGTDALCSGIVAIAWQPNQGAAANRVAATIKANGDVRFECPSGTPTGWLWAWRRAA